MFALTLSSRFLPFAARARVKLPLALSSVPGLRVASYSTYTASHLRSLDRNDLIDTMLLERDNWHHKMMTIKDQAFEKETMLKDRLLAAEARLSAEKDKLHVKLSDAEARLGAEKVQLHLMLSAEKDKLHVKLSAAEARVTAEKVGLLLNERKLRHQLLAAEGRSNATEVRRNEASEARLKSEIELKLTKMRLRELQIALLRSQNRFNLRGIIESIAEQPDYCRNVSPEEKVPSSKHGVQARIDWIIDNSPTYNTFREKIIIHRQIRTIDFNRTSHNVYHELSKHFHENRIGSLDKNADSIIVDMTQDFRKGVFSTVDGAVLESFLHYRHIPYTTIHNDFIEQYASSEPWGDLERTVMPSAYREELYKRLFEGPEDVVKRDGDVAGENGVAMETVGEITSSICDKDLGKVGRAGVVRGNRAQLHIKVTVKFGKVEQEE